MTKQIKVLSLFSLLLLIAFGACNKEDDGPGQETLDAETIAKYAEDKQLNGQFTDSGLYYVIVEAGNAGHPDLNSTITVSYHGYYLNGTTLDEGSFYTEKLSRLIKGWQEGIPLIGEGGKIKMVIPSHLAYGNAILVFDVTLHYFSK